VHWHKNNEYYLFCVRFCFIYLFHDQLRRYGPPLGHLTRLFSRCVGVPCLEECIWPQWIQYQQINLFAYLLNAAISKWSVSQINCSSLQWVIVVRTSITSFNNNDGVRDCRELLEVSQQNVWECIFCVEAIKSKIRNRMGSETLYDSVREALATGIPLIEICNKLLFQWLIHLSSLFLVLTVLNLFHRLHHFIGSSPRAVTFL